MPRALVFAIAVLTCAAPGLAGSRPVVLAAVAANFAGTAAALEPAFEATYPYDLQLVIGSTGQAYAQIRAGAPYDVWLAADQARPARLEAEGGTVPGSRFTYARGRLVLWSRRSDLPADPLAALTDPTVQFVALANPDLAPYGAAAEAVIAALSVDLTGRMVLGQNVGQAYALVATGNADLGFVAQSALAGAGGVVRALDPALYPPILQDAVQLTDTAGAAALMAFLRSDPARAVMQEAGYD